MQETMELLTIKIFAPQRTSEQVLKNIIVNKLKERERGT